MSNLPKTDISNSITAKSYSRHAFTGNGGAHAMMIQFVEYEFSALNSGSFVGAPIDMSGGATGGGRASVILPLPSNLEENFNIAVDRIELNAAGRMAVEYFSELSNTNLRDAFNISKALTENATKKVIGMFSGSGTENNDSVVNSTIANTLGTIESGTVADVINYLARSNINRLPMGVGFAAEVSSAAGAINPHVTLNFDGVNMKEYTFSWNLSPQSPEESETLRQIGRTIKREILPEYDGLSGGEGVGNVFSRAILKYPSIANVYLIGLDEDHYIRFKPGMVTNFTSNFMPNGPSVHRGGRPTSVNFTMQLKEGQIHTRGDYE